MHKIINFIKNNILYILTLFISTIIISTLYKLNSVTPFGGKSLLCVDFFHQYGPMLGELYDRIKSGSNLVYSFNMGLGLPFIRNYLNYLSSPFNIIILLFKRSDLLTSYSYIIGLKAVMSSFTCVYYLSKKFKTKELYLIPLGIIYAFSAYFSSYYWNIMWIDGLVFLPIITLGIENIVNNNKWKMYTIFLAIMLITNYFIGYMICIYSTIYFITYLIYKTKFNKDTFKNINITLKKIGIFAFSSILAGMLVSFLLIPLFMQIKSISATGEMSIPQTQYYDFKLIDYLKSHLTGVKTTTFASDEITSPNISCGILSVALVFIYLINLEIPLKQKISYLLLIGFFIFAFFNPALDYILHAFHVPNDLPYRYSFLYSFILIIIASYGLINIKKIKLPIVIISFLLIESVLLLITKDNWANISNNMIYINMTLLALYFVLFIAYKLLKQYKIFIYIALSIVACIDVVVSINYNWDIKQEMENFYSDYESTEKLLDYVKTHDDSKMYRIEKTNILTYNDPSWYNYNGMTTFTSMAYEDMAKLQNKLGQPGNGINSYYFAQTTPIYDLMFNMKYFIGMQNDFNRYTPFYSEELTAVKFNYNVGLLFAVNKDLLKWDFNNKNPFVVQNDYITKSTGIEEVLKPGILKKTDELLDDGNRTLLKFQYINNNDNSYFYTDDPFIDFFIIGNTLYYKNDNYQKYDLSDYDIYAFEDYNENYIININSSSELLDIVVGYNYYRKNTFYYYQIDNDKFIEAYNKLNKEKVDILDYKENRIIGNVYLEEEKLIYTSIPYDEGWHVYINGEEVKTYPLGNTLLTFMSKHGNNKIELKYITPYQGIGSVISITGLLIFISLCIIEKKNKKTK